MRKQPLSNGHLVGRVSEHLSAVLAALRLQYPREDELLSLDDAGWQKALTLCDHLRLALPLARRPCERYPAWVRERLAGNLTDVARRFACVEEAYCEAAAALAQAGVSQMVLKGFTQAPDFVKAPQYRMQGDIDFYTPREHTLTALDALEAIGYEPAGPTENYRNADHPPTLTRFRGWKWRGNRYDPEMPPPIEVHTRFWNPEVSLISLPEVDNFWSRRINRTLGNLSFWSLAPVDHVCYFALHLLRDLFMGESEIHHAFELATFLHERANDSAFWRQWDSCYSSRLKQMQAIAFALAGAGFSSRMPDVVEEHIRCLPANQRAWIKTCGANLLFQTFPRTRDGRLLQLLLCDSAGARTKILWRTVSPGLLASPRNVANRPNFSGELRTGLLSQLLRYPAYVISRAIFHGAAVLRFVKNSLIVFLWNANKPQEST